MTNRIEQMFSQEGHRLKAAMERLNEAGDFGGEVEESVDEYGYTLYCDKWDAQASFADAYEMGEGEEPGQEANVTVFCTREGGQILPGFTPYNYTDRCWCNLRESSGRKELLRRVDALEEVIEGFADAIKAGLAELEEELTQ